MSSKKLQVRLTEDEWRALELLARELDCDYSTLVREGLVLVHERALDALPAARPQL